METVALMCPYCGSPTEITLDCYARNHDFVEDCIICCGPMLVTVSCDAVTGELTGVSAVRENE